MITHTKKDEDDALRMANRFLKGALVIILGFALFLIIVYAVINN